MMEGSSWSNNCGEIGWSMVVIAIDKDKNSQNAVKWGVDNLLMNKNNTSCTLIHVRTKALQGHPVENDSESISKDGRPPTEQELHRFFLPYRGLCARKGIAAKELVLHDMDVPSALTNYVVNNSITNIVVGSSRWNIFKRKFKDGDVSAKLIKSLPETCTVHIVSKGRVQSIQPQPRSPKDHSSILKLTKSMINYNSPTPEFNIRRSPFRFGSWRRGASKLFDQDLNHALEAAPPNHPHNSNVAAECTHSSDESCSSEKNSSNHSIIPHISNNSSVHNVVPKFNDEISHENQDYCINHPDESLKNLEIEMQRIKHELKQRTKMYSKACKASIAARQRAMELEKLRKEQAGETENSTLAEEAALYSAEEERLRIKAALASAQVWKLMKEMEMKRERHRKRRARRKEQNKDHSVSDTSVHISSQLRIYNIKEIEAATNYFDDALKIGEGGYGPVYKGVLDHTVVAIKALRPELTQGDKQFQKEVDVLSSIRHPNMVILLGACPEFGCLVYEHMEYGSLEDRLLQKDNTPPIPWSIRFRIASEIVLALNFLHQKKPEPIVHRDLKPANILLDRNYVSKICDVGLARLVPAAVWNKSTEYHMTGAAGTFGYIDPEYQQTGLLGVKSDIYSLGITLLQIITAKPPMGLAHTVEKAIVKGKFEDVLDQSVSDWPVQEALSFAKLALSCCEMRKKDRPHSSQVLHHLNQLTELL